METIGCRVRVLPMFKGFLPSRWNNLSGLLNHTARPHTFLCNSGFMVRDLASSKESPPISDSLTYFHHLFFIYASEICRGEHAYIRRAGFFDTTLGKRLMRYYFVLRLPNVLSILFYSESVYYLSTNLSH